MNEIELLSILREFDDEEREDFYKFIKLQRDLKNKGYTDRYIEKTTATQR